MQRGAGGTKITCTLIGYSSCIDEGEGSLEHVLLFVLLGDKNQVVEHQKNSLVFPLFPTVHHIQLKYSELIDETTLWCAHFLQLECDKERKEGREEGRKGGRKGGKEGGREGGREKRNEGGREGEKK